MKWVSRLALCAAFALPLHLAAQNSPSEAKPLNQAPAAADAPKDSALVAAAKKSPANRNKAKLKIDNSTLKKSGGKPTVPPKKGLPKVAPEDTADAIIARHDKAVREWQVNIALAKERIDNLTREITSLEAALGRFEEDFYNEDDPAYRDTLEGKYGSAEERMKAAREELTQAQADLANLESNKPRIR